MKTLLNNWMKEKCPLLNGVIAADGTYHPIRPVAQPRKSFPLELSDGPARKMTSVAIVEWSCVTPLCEFSDKSKGILAVAGEGGMGADGFIALLNPDRSLRWNAFFDFSNPFVALGLEGNELVAENNHGEHWRVPLSTPWKITIESSGEKKKR